MAERGEPQTDELETIHQPPLKRKPCLDPADGGELGKSTKQHKFEFSIEESAAAYLILHKDEVANQNGSSSIENGKSSMVATNMGQGEMVVVEERRNATDGGEHRSSTSQHKPESPIKVSADVGVVVETGDAANHNGCSLVEKGKFVLTAADKGKGKMVVVEEDDSDEQSGQEFEDSSSDDDCSSDENEDDSPIGDKDGEERDICDDPLTEVDLDNILPSRTRRQRPIEPGAYLIEDGDEDEDDEEDDDEDEEEDEDNDAD